MYNVQGQLFPVSCGTAVVTAPGEKHGVCIEENCVFERSYFHIPVPALDFITPELTKCFHDRPFGRDNCILLPPEAMSHCAAEIARIDSVRKRPDFSTVAYGSMLAILSEVSATASASAAVTGRNTSLVTEAILCIDGNVESIRSVQDLANRLFVSREYLSRAFSHRMDTTISDYLTCRRVEKAKEYLMQGKAPDEVSELLGWNSTSYFCRVFKAHTGTTPHQFVNG